MRRRYTIGLTLAAMAAVLGIRAAHKANSTEGEARAPSSISRQVNDIASRLDEAIGFARIKHRITKDPDYGVTLDGKYYPYDGAGKAIITSLLYDNEGDSYNHPFPSCSASSTKLPYIDIEMTVMHSGKIKRVYANNNKDYTDKCKIEDVGVDSESGLTTSRIMFRYDLDDGENPICPVIVLEDGSIGRNGCSEIRVAYLKTRQNAINLIYAVASEFFDNCGKPMPTNDIGDAMNIVNTIFPQK